MLLLSASLTSLLTADTTTLLQELSSIEGLVQSLHLDIMDGLAVPTHGLSVDTIKMLPASWHKEAHLMVVDAAKVINDLKATGIDTFYIGLEAWRRKDLLPISQNKLSLVLNPTDSIAENSSSIQLATTILVMGVVPGWSGHKMLEGTLARVQEVRSLCPNAQIVVDGGVNENNASALVVAGANKLVIGSYLFRASDRKAAVTLLTN